MLPRAKQAWSIERADTRLNIWEGAVRSGKTLSSLWWWIFYVESAPPGELLMAGKTERTLKRNILDPLAEIVGERNFKLVSGSGECWLRGRRIYLAGANDERSEGKIRGLTLAGAYGDELTLWPQSFFTMLLSRLSVPGAQLGGTTNPDSPYHWLMRDYLARVDELDLSRFHFSLEDNPALDPSYVANLKREYTGLWYRRYIAGEWCVAEGAVYEFDPARHVTQALPPAFDQLRVAVDYGTANPTVFLLFGRHAGRWIIAEEYVYDSRAVGRQKTDGQYADDFSAFLAGRHPQSIDVDPSAASFITELRRRGYSVRQANNDVLDGIRVTGKALDSGELQVYAGCEKTIASLATYAWDAKAQARGEDRPLKINDHEADAARYGAMRIFGRGNRTPVKKPKGS